LDLDGNIEWQKSYSEGGWEDAWSIQQTADEGYIVAGYTGSFGAGGDVWILKLNSSGEIEWQKTYGGDNYDDALSTQQTSDGYVVAGRTISFESPGWYLGDFFCAET